MDQRQYSVRVEDLRFTYVKGRPVVLNVKEFAVNKGECVFLHGPSGSGKTTLLGLLAGILAPTAGTVEILGQNLATLPGPKRDAFRGAHIGYVFQMFNLIPYLNVRQNIKLPLSISQQRLGRLQRPADVEVQLLADHLGISQFLDRPVTTLSVGQQQRVAAARALIGAPELIIADEPTSALDTDHRAAFLSILFAEAARTGTSVLFVSHDHTLKSLFQRVVSLPAINEAAVTLAPGEV